MRTELLYHLTHTLPVLDLCLRGNIRLSSIINGFQCVIWHTFRIWTKSVIRLICTSVLLFCAVCKMGLEKRMKICYFSNIVNCFINLCIWKLKFLIMIYRIFHLINLIPYDIFILLAKNIIGIDLLNFKLVLNWNVKNLKKFSNSCIWMYSIWNVNFILSMN